MLLVAAVAAKAELEFTYTAGAELTSAYLWRGQYNGGLSFQPELGVGFETENIAFNVGAWGNIGASDWRFTTKKDKYIDEDGTEINPNTQFMPELDVMLSLSLWGASIGVNHYYYCDGSNFLSWQSKQQILEDENTSSTELWVGYNFGNRLDVGLFINWYVTLAGCDFNYDDDKVTRAYSSYIELGYEHEFERIGLTISADLGISPWRSDDIYKNGKFAVTNISVRVEKAFDLGVCSLSVFAQGMINPNGLNKETAYISAAGDEKLYKQKMNGAVGLGVWF